MVGREARYRASGRTSIRFVPAVVTAVAVAVGLGWAYQALTGPGYAALGVFLYLCFAIGVAAAVAAAGRLGRNRNRALGAAAGLAIAASGLGAAYYVDYRGTVVAVVEGEASGAAGATPTFGEFVDRRVEAGWTFGKRAPGSKGTLTGGWVWFAWSVEALATLAIGLALGVGFGPFCERCGRWMEVEPLFTREGLDGATVDAIAAATTLDGVLRLPAETGARAGGCTLVYSVHRCRTCEADGYVTVLGRRAAAGTHATGAAPQKPRTETLQVQVAIPAERMRALRGRAA